MYKRQGIDSVQQIADEATCQKTMTKVQNNVNEIIGKDYKYVLENMGRPYCTTYYIDMDKVKDISNIAVSYTHLILSIANI